MDGWAYPHAAAGAVRREATIMRRQPTPVDVSGDEAMEVVVHFFEGEFHVKADVPRFSCTLSNQH